MNVPVLPVLPLTQADGRPFASPWNITLAFDKKRIYVVPDQVQLTNPCHAQTGLLDAATQRRITEQVQTQYVLYQTIRVDQSEGCDALLADPISFQSALAAVRSNPWSLYTMKRMACLLQDMIRRDVLLPERRSVTPIANGSFALVAPGVLDTSDPNQLPPFIIKTALVAQSDFETFNELCVGLYATNQLRALIPNFMFVYGAYQCAPAHVQKSAMTNTATQAELCPVGPVGGIETFYELVETIPYARTLAQFIRETLVRFDRPTATAVTDQIIAQVLMALAVAQVHTHFAHQDLHTSNIMIRDLGREVSIRYPLAEDTVVWVRTRYVCVLIDFGFSSCSIRVPIPARIPPDLWRQLDATVIRKEGNECVVHTGKVDAFRGLSPTSPHPLYDVCRFIGTFSVTVSSGTVARHAFRWLQPLFVNWTDYERVRDARDQWARCFNSVPMNIAIRYADVVAYRLPELPEWVVRSIERPAGWPTPLM